jgi:hypothetical protein
VLSRPGTNGLVPVAGPVGTTLPEWAPDAVVDVADEGDVLTAGDATLDGVGGVVLTATEVVCVVVVFVLLVPPLDVSPLVLIFVTTMPTPATSARTATSGSM